MYGHVLSTQGMHFPRILNIGKFDKATISVVNQQYRSSESKNPHTGVH